MAAGVSEEGSIMGPGVFTLHSRVSTRGDRCSRFEVVGGAAYSLGCVLL